MFKTKKFLQKGGKWIKRNIWKNSKTNYNHICDICKSLIMISLTYMILMSGNVELLKIIESLFN